MNTFCLLKLAINEVVPNMWVVVGGMKSTTMTSSKSKLKLRLGLGTRDFNLDLDLANTTNVVQHSDLVVLVVPEGPTGLHPPVLAISRELGGQEGEKTHHSSKHRQTLRILLYKIYL